MANRVSPGAPVLALDSPGRIAELRATVERKGLLKRLYAEAYAKYRDAVGRAPAGGVILELGSGASFIKSVIPEAVTSDVIPYQGVDRVVDATRMPFSDGSLRAILMMNVFHHLPDARAFLAEAVRCLKPGGRVFMLDQHVGWFSRLMLGKLHHEPFLPAAPEWAFAAQGPLSGANGALAWIVFKRDRDRFNALFPELELVTYRPHTALRYWLAGGLKPWSLLPGWSFPLVSILDRVLAAVVPGASCFVDVELRKR